MIHCPQNFIILFLPPFDKSNKSLKVVCYSEFFRSKGVLSTLLYIVPKNILILTHDKITVKDILWWLTAGGF